MSIHYSINTNEFTLFIDEAKLKLEKGGKGAHKMDEASSAGMPGEFVRAEEQSNYVSNGMTSGMECACSQTISRLTLSSGRGYSGSGSIMVYHISLAWSMY